MDIRRCSLTNQSIRATPVKLEAGRVQVTADGQVVSAGFWLTAGEALAVAAVALGADPSDVETARWYEVTGATRWSIDELADIITSRLHERDADGSRPVVGGHLSPAVVAAAVEARMDRQADVDEAEAAEVER